MSHSIDENLLVEKRCAPRQPVTRQLTVRKGDYSCSVLGLDQSPGGFRFVCPEDAPLAPEDSLEIESTEPELRFSGRVAWVRAMASSGSKQVGVEREEPVIFSLERRRYVRVHAPELTVTAGLHSLRVLDVSLRGLRVETRESLATEEPIQIDLHLPGPPLSLSARVLESRGSVARLALVDLDPSAHERLALYLQAALRSAS